MLREPRGSIAVSWMTAIGAEPALLLVRTSYLVGWHLPGGGVRRDETPEIAARRELAEEIGLTASALLPAGATCGTWGGRRTRLHFFELQLPALPKLQLDNREVTAARLTWFAPQTPGDTRDMCFGGVVA
jgi:8-oxo-dGTP diphosphatase